MEKYKNDFEAWAHDCVRIRHKLTGQMVPFDLNAPQRKLLAVMERQRHAGRPIRVIVLKARQWGSSTLIAHYMVWIQLFHAENWNSVTCAQLLNTAATIRRFVTNVVRNYPEEIRPEGFKLSRFENSREVLELCPTGACVAICSAESVDATRGMDLSMAHLSEVAFWPEGRKTRATDVVRSIIGTVPRVANSLIVMESTANGVGNFFHRQWCRATSGESDFEPVFVPWFEIEHYREPLTVPLEVMLQRLSPRERELMDTYNLEPEQINWYNLKRRELDGDQELMAAEYPSNPSEAFNSGETAVFEPREVEALRAEVCEPQERLEYSGATNNFVPNASGALAVWEQPKSKAGYILTLDIGSVWRGGDWSVAAVFDVTDKDRMRLVAQWRGHERYDRLADLSVALARRYGDALLAIESNSDEGRALSVIERMVSSGYRNLFQRANRDTATGALDAHYGFHTNRATKTAAIGALSAMLRDGTYTERSAAAVEELAAYSRGPGDTMAAPDGAHDDMVMTRAIAAYVATFARPAPPVPFPKFF